MSKVRPYLLTFLCLAGVLGAAAGGAAWWHHTTRPEYRLRRGQEAVRRGDFAEGEQYAVLLTAAGCPDHTHLLRGEAFFRKDQYSRALTEFNAIRDQGDLRLDAAVLSGECLYRLGSIGQAERTFLFVLQHRPEQLEAHRCLAGIYYDLGALMRAVQHAEKWAELDPADGRAHRLMGLIYKDLGQPADAVRCYQEALRRGLSERVTDEARLEMATCLVKEHEYDEAVQALDRLPPETAQSAEAAALRGECLWGQGKANEARTLLDQALANHPNSLELLRLRANIHLAEKEPAAAATLFERVLKADRHDHATRYQLAQAYESLGRPADAAEQLRLRKQTQDLLDEMTRLSAELANKPGDAPLCLRLAEVCEQLDRPKLAQMWRQAAATGAPPSR